ncbi:hypothetical protein JTE90_016405 [Oedothorax gibbosus]|uniref:Uncharacterized protein n=1 Tax=Oedothorax gibbosus TaxID=931172 RepID=A0AAV6TDR4_9ARAC|nr:hypothetical protein JTE90_016405 [Oedothorax gibbosus]
MGHPLEEKKRIHKGVIERIRSRSETSLPEDTKHMLRVNCLRRAEPKGKWVLNITQQQRGHGDKVLRDQVRVNATPNSEYDRREVPREVRVILFFVKNFGFTWNRLVQERHRGQLSSVKSNRVSCGIRCVASVGP